MVRGLDRHLGPIYDGDFWQFYDKFFVKLKEKWEFCLLNISQGKGTVMIYENVEIIYIFVGLIENNFLILADFFIILLWLIDNHIFEICFSKQSVIEFSK